MKLDQDLLAEDEEERGVICFQRRNSIDDDKTLAFFRRLWDAQRKEKYQGAKACPRRDFQPCLEDKCAMFINEYPGRPWWGYCAYRDMGGR